MNEIDPALLNLLSKWGAVSALVPDQDGEYQLVAQLPMRVVLVPEVSIISVEEAKKMLSL